MKADGVKRPAFQFYPGDWRRDTALQSCSAAARGIWTDLICLMHDGEPYGHLAVQGRALTEAQLASLVGEPVARFRKLLAELEAAGVPSRTADGILFSRRMVRDERIRNVRAASGKKGGNPNLLGKQVVNQTDNQSGNQTGEQKPTPAVASASAENYASTPPPPAREAVPQREESPLLRRCRDSLPAEYREVFEQALRAHRNPGALAAELCAIADGIRGTPAPTWAHLGLALHDMALAGQPMSANLLRAFARRARDGAGELHDPPPRGSADRSLRGGAPSKVEAMTERSLKAVESWAGQAGKGEA